MTIGSRNPPTPGYRSPRDAGAVTSVSVVSKIFANLKILHTRFARLVLGVAVPEDIVLWIALAVATATSDKGALNPL